MTRRTIGVVVGVVGVIAAVVVLLAVVGGGGRVDWTAEVSALRDEDLVRFAPSGSVVGSSVTIFDCREDASGDLRPGVGRRDALDDGVSPETVLAEFEEVAREGGWTAVDDGGGGDETWQSWSKQFDEWTGEVRVTVREGEDSYVTARISEPEPCPQFD